jgi:flagellar basal-body rod protein FlgB
MGVPNSVSAFALVEVNLCTLPGPHHFTEKIGFIRNARFVDNLVVTITTQRIELLTRLLDVAAMRQDVIAQNVANVNTPGYTTLAVSFEDALKEALTPGSGGRAPAVAAEVVPGTGGRLREDGNNVDIDLEMARLQKNAIYFQVYAQMLANDLAQFRSAIKGQ